MNKRLILLSIVGSLANPVLAHLRHGVTAIDVSPLVTELTHEYFVPYLTSPVTIDGAAHDWPAPT